MIGNTVADGLVIDGDSDLNGDLDVDGHTNLDNVSVAGVSTFSGTIETTGSELKITGAEPRLTFTDTDNNPDFQIWANAQRFSIYDNTNNATRLRINSGGEVLIGTETGTGHNLTVQDAGTSTTAGGNIVARFQSNGSGRDASIQLSDNVAHSALISMVSSNFAINLSGNERLRISSVGHLGVGDDNPDTRLSVKAASGTDVVGKFTSTDANAWIQFRDNTTTDTAVMVGANGNNLLFRAGSNTRWKIDSSGHFVPNSPGSFNIGSTSLEIGDIYLGVNKKVFCGLSQELQLYTDGTNGYLKETNGDLYLQSTADDVIIRAADNISIQAQGGEYCIDGNGNGSVNLYYDAGTYTTPKLKTSATGIEVHGEVDASQDYPLTKPVLDFNFAAEKKLDPRFQFTRESIATFIDKKGIVRYSSENQPRFDHHPTSGVSLGLLLEREQTNYQEYSTLMSEANHKNNITVTDNFAISPDGTQNASKIVNATSNNVQTNIGWSASNVASGSYAMWSVWVKSEETSCILSFYSNTYIFGADRVNIELADGTYDGTSASSTFRFNIEKYPNKWWRVSVGGNGSGYAGGWYISLVDSKTAARGATCGSATNKTWFVWGVQEEIGTLSRIATSYIPTNGAAVLRKGDRATMDGDDFDDFFDRFQGTVINEHSNALQSIEGGGSGWEFNNDQLQVNLIAQTGSGYAHSHYPGCQASVFGDRNSGGSGGSGSPGTDYIQLYGPNSTIVNGGIQNGAANSGYGRYPGNLGGSPDYTRYYRTWIDAMSYDLTPSTNILRTATGGETTEGTNTESISLANVSKFELGNDATDLLYSNYFGRIKRWVYYDKVVTQNQLGNLTAQLPQSYL